MNTLKQFFLGTVLSVIMMAGFTESEAQTSTRQIIFVSGGKFGVDKRVKLFSYDPSKKAVRKFDSIPGSFTNRAIIRQDTGYFSADSKLYRYNTSTLKVIDSLDVESIFSLKLYKNMLIIGKGFGATSGYLAFYRSSDLKLIYADTSVHRFVADLVLEGDSLYALMNTANFPSADTSFIATYDLKGAIPKQKRVNRIGSFQWGADRIFRASGNDSFFYGSTISYTDKPLTFKYNRQTGKTDTTRFTSVQAPIRLMGQNLYLNINGSLSTFNFATRKATPIVSRNFANGLYDQLMDEYYLITSDFVHNDEVFRYSSKGTLIDSFAVGASTEGFAADYGTLNAVSEVRAEASHGFVVYPNPANDLVNMRFDSPLAGRMIVLSDLSGRVIRQETVSGSVYTMDISSLPMGMYILRSGSEVSRLIKQ